MDVLVRREADSWWAGACRALIGGVWLCLAALAVPAQANAPLALQWDRASVLSRDAQIALTRVLAANDNAGAPFIVIDKRRARLWLFDPHGRPSGSTPVLLGFARGDDTVPGIGDKPLASVRPGERTTPAGRFVGEHGRNLKGDDIIWVDYEAAVSIHRVHDVHQSDQREQRLRSRSIADNRISYGCINVPKAFYEQVLLPLVGAAAPVVYLLPETRPAASIFNLKSGPGLRPGGTD